MGRVDSRAKRIMLAVVIMIAAFTLQACAQQSASVSEQTTSGSAMPGDETGIEQPSGESMAAHDGRWDAATIACGQDTTTVGIKNDGTAITTHIRDDGATVIWDEDKYVSVVRGFNSTYLLCQDGTVKVKGGNIDEATLASWHNIAALAVGQGHLVGLCEDGTVVAALMNGASDFGQCDVSDWDDIIAISACANNTVGLRADGTVLALGDNKYGQCDVSGWSDVVSVATGGEFTVGARSDGTVVAVGNNRYGECDVANWSNIKKVFVSNVTINPWRTIGIRDDGTVVAAGFFTDTSCFDNWSDIAAVSFGWSNGLGEFTVGLRNDGTCVVGCYGLDSDASGNSTNAKIKIGGEYYDIDGTPLDVLDWDGIRVP